MPNMSEYVRRICRRKWRQPTSETRLAGILWLRGLVTKRNMDEKRERGWVSRAVSQPESLGALWIHGLSPSFSALFVQDYRSKSRRKES